MSEQRADLIEKLLRQALNPLSLEIEDQSHLHAGHAGAKDGRGHFRVVIVAEQFRGKSALQCHRLIYTTLDKMMQTDIHALTIDARPPAR